MIGLGVISSYFDIKRLQKKQRELEIAYLEVDLMLAKTENKLIELEEPQVRPYLAREFAMSRAFADMCCRVGMPAYSKSTEDCIKMARLWAKLEDGIIET